MLTKETIAIAPRQWHGLAVIMAVAANFTLELMNAAVKWLTLQGYSTFQIASRTMFGKKE